MLRIVPLIAFLFGIAGASVAVAQSPPPTPQPSVSACPRVPAGNLFVKFPQRINYTDSLRMTSSFILIVHGDGALTPMIPNTWDMNPMRGAILDFLEHVVVCGNARGSLVFWIFIDRATGVAHETQIRPQ